MKNNWLKSMLLLAFIVIAAVSCKKDDDPEPLTKEESVEALNTMGTNMEVAMEEMMTAEAVTSITYLSELFSFEGEEPAPENFSAIKSLPKSIEKVARFNVTDLLSAKSKKVVEEDFGSTTGTMTWNHETLQWDYSSSPTDKFIVLFPSDSLQTTNNASLTISDFTSVSSGEDLFPTSLKISLLVNGIEVLSVDYSAEVVSNALQSLTLSVELNPYSASVSLSLTPSANNLLVNFSHEFKKDNVKLMSSSIEMLLKGIASFDVFAEEETMDEIIPSYIKGFVQMGEVKVQANASIENFMLALENSSSADDIAAAANNHLKFTLYTYPQGALIANVKWVWDSQLMDIVPYLVFSDGSEMPLADFIPEDFDFDIEF